MFLCSSRAPGHPNQVEPSGKLSRDCLVSVNWGELLASPMRCEEIKTSNPEQRTPTQTRLDLQFDVRRSMLNIERCGFGTISFRSFLPTTSALARASVSRMDD